MSDYSYQEKKLRLQLLIEERNLVDSLISSDISDGNTTSITVKEERRKELDNEIKQLQLEISDISLQSSEDIDYDTDALDEAINRLESGNSKKTTDILPADTAFLFIMAIIALSFIAVICFQFAVDSKNEYADDYSSETASTESTSTTVVIGLEPDIEAPTRTPKLSNSPVEITPEVDNYFKTVVTNLKGAMSVDQIIGTSDMLNDLESQQKFKENYGKWKESLVEVSSPSECAEFHEMYKSAVEGYVLYFDTVEDGITTNTSTEVYAANIKAALTTVQNNTAKYEDLAEDYFIVFNYYGLYSGQ